jgi:hypothetical protein
MKEKLKVENLTIEVDKIRMNGVSIDWLFYVSLTILVTLVAVSYQLSVIIDILHLMK